MHMRPRDYADILKRLEKLEIWQLEHDGKRNMTKAEKPVEKPKEKPHEKVVKKPVKKKKAGKK